MLYIPQEVHNIYFYIVDKNNHSLRIPHWFYCQDGWNGKEWASEWLLFNANSAIFQLYHGENNLIFNEMMMRSALYETNMLSWIFIVLAHWNNSPRIDMSFH